MLTAASASKAQQVFIPFSWKLMGLLVLGPSCLELIWAQVLLMGVGVAESRAVSTWELGRGFGVGRGHKEGPGCLQDAFPLLRQPLPMEGPGASKMVGAVCTALVVPVRVHLVARCLFKK